MSPEIIQYLKIKNLPLDTIEDGDYYNIEGINTIEIKRNHFLGLMLSKTGDAKWLNLSDENLRQIDTWILELFLEFAKAYNIKKFLIYTDIDTDHAGACRRYSLGWNDSTFNNTPQIKYEFKELVGYFNYYDDNDSIWYLLKNIYVRGTKFST